MSRPFEEDRPGRAAALPQAPWHAALREGRGYRLGALALALALLTGLFWSTPASMAAIWWRSETFAHGFLIFPISAWLIWRMRSRLREIPLYTDFRAVLALIALGFGWTLARSVDVLVVEQLAWVAMIPALVWLLLGWRAVWTLVFPLAYLILAVPMGEALIPPLMEFTAVFTVRALQITGVPVYWEGLFFTLPTGSWSIVEGCSGVRYLIASVTIGLLYAYLTYYTLWRRALFVALAAIVPIVANGFRAYMIVMIGHLSNMKLATGVDHIIYGWVFFGIVIGILFWVGLLWRERDEPPPSSDGGAGPSPSPAGEPRARLGKGLAVAVLAVAVWPAWAAYMDRPAETGAIELAAPAGAAGWAPSDDTLSEWTPRYLNPTTELRQVYAKSGERVGLHLAFYAAQTQGAEVVNSQNVMIEQKHPVWSQPYLREISVRLGGEAKSVYESELRSSGQELVAWYWYWIAERHLANPYEAKVYEALAKLFGQGREGAGIVVFTGQRGDLDAARARLQRFLDDMLSAVEQSLKRSVQQAAISGHQSAISSQQAVAERR